MQTSNFFAESLDILHLGKHVLLKAHIFDLVMDVWKKNDEIMWSCGAKCWDHSIPFWLRWFETHL